MSDELKQRLLSDEPVKSIVDDLVVRALKANPLVQAEQRECEAWEDRVINGDPSARDMPTRVLRG